jgi:hypothetical protein
VIRPTCAVIAAVALGSCGTEPDRHAVEIREVVGFWRVTLTPDASCTRFNPAPGLDLNITVLSHTGADIVTLQGGWELAPVTNPSRPLAGTLDLRTGAFHADLTSTSAGSRGRLEGSIGTGTGLTGRLTDPGSGGTVGILGFGSCTYAAAGQH